MYFIFALMQAMHMIQLLIHILGIFLFISIILYAGRSVNKKTGSSARIHAVTELPVSVIVRSAYTGKA